MPLRYKGDSPEEQAEIDKRLLDWAEAKELRERFARLVDAYPHHDSIEGERMLVEVRRALGLPRQWRCWFHGKDPSGQAGQEAED